MKTLLALILLTSAVVIVGCGSEKPLPDPTESKKPLPPGTKTKDVLLPINK